jgi:cell division protein FtsB
MSTSAMQVRSRIPRIAEVAVERARLTVVPRRQHSAGRMPFLALVSMVLLGGVVGLLLFNTSMQQASFASTALEQQANRLAARQQSLEMELDRLRDPQRVASAAQRLGMVQACSPAFLRLGTGEVSGQPCVGTTPLRIQQRLPGKPAVLDPPPNLVTVPPATTEVANQNSVGDTTPGSTARAGREGRKNR